MNTLTIKGGKALTSPPAGLHPSSDQNQIEQKNTRPQRNRLVQETSPLNHHAPIMARARPVYTARRAEPY